MLSCDMPIFILNALDICQKICYICVTKYYCLFLPYINFCLSFKVKGKVPLCMPWHKGSGDMDALILNLGSSWRWLVSFMPGCLISGERVCVMWSGACLDILDKSKYLAPIGIWILDYPASSVVTILTEVSCLRVWWPLISFIAHIISCMVTYIFNPLCTTFKSWKIMCGAAKSYYCNYVTGLRVQSTKRHANGTDQLWMLSGWMKSCLDTTLAFSNQICKSFSSSIWATRLELIMALFPTWWVSWMTCFSRM